MPILRDLSIEEPTLLSPAGEDSLIVAASRAMFTVRELARRAGRSDAKALITGESGVGKDLVAREIHARSSRAHRPFVAVNCAGLAEGLLESELFGHVKGSFTGAYRDRRGKIQEADDGTLFLDEVGEMSLRMQAMLLRFLENGEIQTVGDAGPRQVNVRVIAATNRNLPERVAAGQFREDLLYRLGVIHVVIPPLRERPADIPALVEHLIRQSGHAVQFSGEAMRALTRYRWPGNVRELQNVVEQSVWLATGPTIELADLPEAVRTAGRNIVRRHERRRQVGDQLFEALLARNYTFWEHVHPLFLNRDLTRHDIRELVSRGLSATKGNYRAMLKLFGMTEADYHRFHNFLAAHDCKVDFRTFRNGTPAEPSRSPVLPQMS
jgi:transcriptional regulator with PAS, ATPase and Fis domain